MLPESFPAPHGGPSLGREREAKLMRQHADLAAVMCVVHDHIDEHRTASRPRLGPSVPMKMFDAAGRVSQRLGKHLRTAFGALRERRGGLLLRAPRALKRRWQLYVRSGKPQPLAANVVHMTEGVGDRARAAAGKFRAPGARIQF